MTYLFNREQIKKLNTERRAFKLNENSICSVLLPICNLGKGGLIGKNLKDINIFSPGGGVSCPQKGEAMKANEMLSLLKRYHWGLQRAIPLKALAQSLGISEREVRRLKNYLVIEQRQPIGSTNDGYFYAENPEELKRFVKEYAKRNGVHFEMIKAYKDMLQPKGQLELGVGA